MGAYLVVYRCIWLALFGFMAYCYSWVIFYTIQLLRLPDVPQANKWRSLRSLISSFLLWPMILGANLHWPIFAQAIIWALLITFGIWTIIDSRRILKEQPQRIAEARQQCAMTHARTIERLRQEGVYPAEGQLATDDQINHLLGARHDLDAIGLYQKAHQVEFKEAVAAINRMRKEMKTG